MKQEKKQTVFFDLETKLEPWQKQLLGGIKKGEHLTVSYGRKTGKSQMTAMYMATYYSGGTKVGGTAVFGSPWDEWEDTFVWPWDRKTSVESGRKIWGRIKVRYNKIVYEANGRQKQYATKEEAFKRKLRGADLL